MKIKLHLQGNFDGPARKCRLPFPEADHAVAEGSCPACGVQDTPFPGKEGLASGFKVAGAKGTMVRGHDTYTSDGGCVACKAVLGKLVVTVNTIFGIREDEEVLSGRCRVY